MIDIKSLPTEQLRNLVDNHRRLGATASPTYVDALEELERRTGKGLNFEKSLATIRTAAKEGRFLSYKELADASEVSWSIAHYAINKHLGNLVEYCHRKGWPLLSAIVVNKPNVGTGEMEKSSLKGFLTAARMLGIQVADEHAFLREQQ